MPRLSIAVAACAWLVGLSRLLAARGVVTATLPKSAEPPSDVHDLASWRFGPTVRASSYFRDPLAHHHPLFLVDERRAPTLLEKWASAPGDTRPWVEIRWREPHDLDRVVIRHAGAYEDPALTVRSYVVSCLVDAGAGPSVVVEHNDASVATHPLACPKARGVRVDVRLEGGDLARIYEIEAWGR